MMRDTALRGLRRAIDLVEDVDAPVCTPPADRGPESEGAGAGAKHKAQAPLMTSLPSFTTDGCAPAVNGPARPSSPPAEAAVAWWCLPFEADPYAEPSDHDAFQAEGSVPLCTPQQRGGKRGLGSVSR